MRRRAFLTGGGSALLLPGVAGGCQQAARPDSVSQGQGASQANRLERFGLQLSTVTSLMLADFEGTLAQVSQIGYQQVEFSAMGFLGRSAAQVQQLLTRFELEAPVGRVAPKLSPEFFRMQRADALQAYRNLSAPENLLQNVAHSLDSALALGQRYLVLPALMPDQFESLDQVKRNLERINQAATLCASQGVVFGYHNHSWELAALDGVIPYQLLLEQTDPAQVTFQLDSYWIRKGGGSLHDYLQRYPGRFATCHMKDIDAAGDFADVGEGLIDFPRFTREALAQGARYFFVERDNPPNPLASIQRSHAYLQQMTF